MSANPVQQSPACPDAIDQAHIDQFQRDGYLAFEDVLSLDEVESTRTALTELATGLILKAQQNRARVVPQNESASRNYSGARIQENDGPFGVHFEPGFDPLSLSVEEAELKIRKLYSYHQEHSIFRSLVVHPRIKGFVESILGMESILKNEMALSKVPDIGSEKPWHQDNAYFVYVPLDSIITAWIALDDATEDNGCMFVIPGGHKIGALKHVHGADCEILEGRLDKSEAIPIELKAGGAMFFSGMLPHQTPPNTTSTRRRALQFQYRGTNTKALTAEEFAKVFVEADGTPASCAVGEHIG